MKFLLFTLITVFLDVSLGEREIRRNEENEEEPMVESLALGQKEIRRNEENEEEPMVESTKTTVDCGTYECRTWRTTERVENCDVFTGSRCQFPCGTNFCVSFVEHRVRCVDWDCDAPRPYPNVDLAWMTVSSSVFGYIGLAVGAAVVFRRLWLARQRIVRLFRGRRQPNDGLANLAAQEEEEDPPLGQGGPNIYRPLNDLNNDGGGDIQQRQ